MSSDDYILGPLLDNAKCTKCDEEFHIDEKHRCKPHLAIHKTLTEIIKNDPESMEIIERIFTKRE